MKSGPALAFVLAAVIATAAAADPQPVPAPKSQQQAAEQPPIVIVGERLKQALRNFIVSLTQSGPTDQIARWKDEVCPAVIGLDPDEARFMEDRVSALGKMVGLRASTPGCATSLAVIVTPDAAGFATDLVRQYPITLRTDGYGRVRRFAESTAPVRWISVTDECGGGCGLPGSRLSESTTPTLVDMIVVVDAKQITGFTIGELADYVALVALSNPPLNGRRSPNSILSMFITPRAPQVPFAVTRFDLSFLDGLYASSLNKSMKVQRSTILSRMRKDLDRQK